MGLWDESLFGYGGGVVEANADQATQARQVLHIISHLAMPVPRHWWEQMLQDGVSGDQWMLGGIAWQLVRECRKASWLRSVHLSLFLALAFVDRDGRQGRANEDETGLVSVINALLHDAEQALQRQPELIALAHEVDTLIKRHRPELSAS